ncbi:pentapeptide repeat-containing protein [Klenkia brasiliensis]|uniref:Pentapeptide repeat-containing protein n=1 Tax=Klenkia brasiliensis TaxID=333142 RepID=A0A1G7NAX2_9ACTN|nr:pentapeptide repeat-containing protein [Klenkia brasiliensis]SDF71106.1 hypothetical protein SAMN05660324_0962 [Klenkia brasiliensis]
MDVAELLDPLPPLTDGGPHDLAGGSADGLRFTDLEPTGEAGQLLECLVEGCALDGLSLVRARLSTTGLLRCTATELLAHDGTWLDVVVEGGRYGALTAHGASWTRVTLTGVRADYVNLRGATLVEVEVVDCTLRELDLGGADLRRLRVTGGELGTLHLSGARCRDVDLTGAGLPDLDGVTGLRGATISAAQLVGWSGGMAAELGIRIAR